MNIRILPKHANSSGSECKNFLTFYFFVGYFQRRETGLTFGCAKNTTNTHYTHRRNVPFKCDDPK